MKDYAETSDQTADGAGVWRLCPYCDEAWRPDGPETHDADCPVGEVLQLREDNRQLTEQLRMWEASSNDFAPVDGSQEQRSIETPSRGRRAPGGGLEPPSPGARFPEYDPDVIRKQLNGVLSEFVSGNRSYEHALDDVVEHVLYVYRAWEAST